MPGLKSFKPSRRTKERLIHIEGTIKKLISSWAMSVNLILWQLLKEQPFAVVT